MYSVNLQNTQKSIHAAEILRLKIHVTNYILAIPNVVKNKYHYNRKSQLSFA